MMDSLLALFFLGQCYGGHMRMKLYRYAHFCYYSIKITKKHVVVGTTSEK